MQTPFSADLGSIPGYFDYSWLYDRIIDRCTSLGAPFVEVGVFMGKSLAYAAQRAGGQVRVIGIDAFDGRAMGDGLAANNITPDADMYALCRSHLMSVGMLEHVELICAESATSAGLFADASLGAVFIDADHDEEAVRADIQAWLPKVMPGGILAGHDIFMEGVHAAFLSDIIGHPRVIEGSARGESTCWYSELKNQDNTAM